MFDLPSLEGVEEVVISKEVVEGTARPLYIYADRAGDCRRDRLNLPQICARMASPSMAKLPAVGNRDNGMTLLDTPRHPRLPPNATGHRFLERIGSSASPEWVASAYSHRGSTVSCGSGTASDAA